MQNASAARKQQSLFENRTKTLHALSTLDNDMDDFVHEVHNFAISGSAGSKRAYLRLDRKLESDFDALNKAHFDDPQDREALRRAFVNFQRYRRSSRQIFTLKDPRSELETAHEIDKRATVYANKFSEELRRLHDKEQAEFVDISSSFYDFNRRISFILASLAGLAVVSIFVISFLIVTNIARPINQMLKGTTRIGGGDLDFRLNIVTGDEIEQLAKGFNEMASNLKKSHDETQNQLLELSELYRISTAITQTIEADELLNLILNETLNYIGAESGSIMLLEPETGDLVIRASQGLSREVVQKTRVPMSKCIAVSVASVASGQKPLALTGRESFCKPDDRQVKHSLCVPLIAQNKPIGAICANKYNDVPFSQQGIDFVSTLAGNMALVIENVKLFEAIRVAYLAVIRSLVDAIEAKDSYTKGHSERVAFYAVSIGQELDLPSEAIEGLQTAAYLHDIGKIGIPDHLLLKKGALTKEELDEVKLHPDVSDRILRHIKFSWEVLPTVRYHHERWDGTGYPDGLRGEAIPLGARILALADSFDAMTSNRPYRPALSEVEAISQLRRESWKKYDGRLVELFIGILGQMRKDSKKGA